MERAVLETWHHIQERDFPRAREHAAQIADDERRAKALRHIRTAQARAIGELWELLHRAGAYTPVEHLTLNLDDDQADDLISEERLDELFAAAALRLTTRDRDLPHGWEWVVEWQGRHPDGRETALHMERAGALREMRRQMTEQERARQRRRRQRRPVDDELFPEETGANHDDDYNERPEPAGAGSAGDRAEPDERADRATESAVSDAA